MNLNLNEIYNESCGISEKKYKALQELYNKPDEYFDDEVKDMLLIKAKESYPIGTKFKCLKTNEIRIALEECFESKFSQYFEICTRNFNHGVVYSNGEWAEIITE